MYDHSPDETATTAVRRQQGKNAMPPLMLRAPQAATLCAVSVRTWRTWDAAGKIPQPIRIGRSTLWRAEELRAWIAAGCPRRKEWVDLQS